MSDVVWQALIAAVVTLVLAWMQRATKKAVEGVKDANLVASDAATTRAAEVKTDLLKAASKVESQLERVEKLGVSTHTLSVANHTLLNGGMEIQLQIAALALRRVADMGGDELDIRAAEYAEQRLAEHRERLAAGGMITGQGKE